MKAGSKKILLMATIASLLTGCGGGGGDTSSSTPAPAKPAPVVSDGDPAPAPVTPQPEEPAPQQPAPEEPTPQEPAPEEPEPEESEPEPVLATNRMTQGVITGFGSVYVNGERYLVNGTEIEMDGSNGVTVDDLKVGMVIRLVAGEATEGDTAEALSIQYESQLVGTVSFIDLEASTFSVLGQTIAYDELTAFALTDGKTLATNDHVKISGFTDDNGVVHATYVTSTEFGDENQSLKGFVSGLDSQSHTFMLGNLAIDYTGAAFDGLTLESLQNGAWVEASGQINEAVDVMFAEHLKGFNTQSEDGTAEFVLSGVVANTNTENRSFSLNEHRISVDEDTQFINGSEGDLSKDARVSVTAVSSEDGIVVAKSVEFKSETMLMKAEGVVSAIDLEARTFTVNNQTFSLTTETQFVDSSSLQVWDFSLEDLAVNEWVKVVSSVQEGVTAARKVERIEQAAREGKLSGTPESITTIGFELNGVYVEFVENTQFDSAEGIIDYATFMEQINTPSVVVKVEGKYSDADALEAYEVKVIQTATDDNAQNAVKTEFEGRVTKSNDGRVFVAGRELVFNDASQVTISCVYMTPDAFINELRNNDVIWVEGVQDDEGRVVVESAAL